MEGEKERRASSEAEEEGAERQEREVGGVENDTAEKEDRGRSEIGDRVVGEREGG